MQATKKKIAIIGAGIAGLSAGIYAQQLGFDSEIYEMHSIVGGQCTGWDRQGYHIDGCIHWLTGTKENTQLNDVWRNVGVIDDSTQIIQLDNFGTNEFEGVSITFWKDIDRLQSELLAISPQDSALIKQFIQDVKDVQTAEMPVEMPFDMLPLKEKIKLLLSMKKMGEVMNRNKMKCSEYAQQYKHPALRKMFLHSMPEGYSNSAMIFGLATFSSGNGAIPKNGSREFADRMAKRYQELGGTIHTNAPVAEILIDNGIAQGIQLKDATTVFADYVIASCDAKFTFDKLLKGNYPDKRFEKRFENSTDYALPTSVMVSFGVSEDLRDYPSMLNFETEPYKVGITTLGSVGFKNYSYEDSFAPKGHTVVSSTINQSDNDYLYWEKLYQDKDAYAKEKKRIATEIHKRIENRFPELVGKITLLDVATPMTYQRYANAYHGAWMSFMLTPKSKMMSHSGKIKGLKNCYLTGQWLQPPGGLPVAVTTGRFTIQRICKKEGKRMFV